MSSKYLTEWAGRPHYTSLLFLSNSHRLSLLFNLKFYDYYYYFFNVYLFLRARQSVSRGEGEREGDRESETGWRLWGVCQHRAHAGLELINCEIMTWSQTLNWLGHPGTPMTIIFNLKIIYPIIPMHGWLSWNCTTIDILGLWDLDLYF